MLLQGCRHVVVIRRVRHHAHVERGPRVALGMLQQLRHQLNGLVVGAQVVILALSGWVGGVKEQRRGERQPCMDKLLTLRR